jgi:peptidoglycan/xylan/chitin deacetylase (PgdA/CDA1 family)
MSIRRALFERLGRFDVSFTRQGLYGGEDVDFGYRVLRAGCRVVFNPAAISFQYYDVDPADYLRRGYEAGRSEHELIVKHPERAEQLDRGPHLHTRLSRWLLGPFVLAPPALSGPLRATVAALVRSGREGRRLRAAFLNVRAMEYRRGVRDARRALDVGKAVVLAYHAIADLGHDPVLSQYGVPAARLAAQLDDLIGHGWSFIGVDALLGALRGEQRLPERAVLVTFDDAYADLLSAALPVLAERGIPAVAFAVSGRIGDKNAWDREIGGGTLRLLDAAGLRAVAERGVEIGSHGYAHRRLTPDLAPEELAAELEGSAEQLHALGLPRPRVLSYPYGVCGPAVASAVGRAGYEAAFTVQPGVVRRGADRFALPRVEALASDTPRRLRLKVVTAGWPDRRRTRALRLLRVRQ